MVNGLSAFDQYFEILAASTQEQVKQTQRLRFEVFSLERQIFSQDQYPDGIEFDTYDKRCVHSLLMHRATSRVAATVRLVLSDGNHPSEEFPLEKRLQGPLYYEDLDLRTVPRSSVAEISRFAISKQFRHRAGDDTFSYEDNDRRVSVNQLAEDRRSEGRRSFPHISLGLLKAIVQMSTANGVQYWYAAMEPSFIRLLSRFGVKFHPLGPVIEYLGKRQPCVASVEDLLGNMAMERPDVWEFITDNGGLLAGKYLLHQSIGGDDKPHR